MGQPHPIPERCARGDEEGCDAYPERSAGHDAAAVLRTTYCCQPISRARITPSSIAGCGGGDLERHCRREAGPLAEQRPGQHHRGVRARRGRGPEAGGQRQRPRPVVTEKPHDAGGFPDHGLDYRRQPEPQDQRPGDRPRHRRGNGQRMHDGVHGLTSLGPERACRVNWKLSGGHRSTRYRSQTAI